MTLAVFGPEAVMQRNGTPARGVPIEVVLRGTQTHAPIYEDEDGLLPLGNPVTSDEHGNLFFCIAPGDYDLLVNSGRIPFIAQVTGGAGGGTYEFTQNPASALWTIVHNLGFRPAVTVEVGGEVVLADVAHVSNTTTTVTFALPQVGKAYLS